MKFLLLAMFAMIAFASSFLMISSSLASSEQFRPIKNPILDVKRLAIVESSTKSTYRANIYYSVTNSSDNFIAYFEIDIFAYDGKGNLLGKCFLANGSNLKVGDTIKKDSPCFNIKASNIAKWDTQLKTVHVIQEKITYEVTDHFSVNLK